MVDKYMLFPFESHQRRLNCLFIHIPKTAGTAILEGLGKKRTHYRQHFPWYVYQAANRKYFTNSFKFSFVRNPYDRLYSAYEYLKAGGAGGGGDRAAGEALRKYQDFDDFIYQALHLGDLRNNLHFIPQSNFILDLCGKPVVDYLGRQETIDDDFAEIAKHLGITSRLKQKNTTAGRHHKDYRLAYKSDRSIEIVQNLYAQDLRVFNYQFE